MGLITLVTDFGLRDEYVGVMKGVILGRNPDARIVDLSHGIDPQDVRQAAYLLKAAYPYFPAGSVHTAVVDPGVGSQRAILAARYDGHVFLAPDNGLLSGIWEENSPDALVRVENKALFLEPVSHSFHGRDIFAPIAAHLSLGMDIGALGPALALDQAVHLAFPRAELQADDQLSGQVIAIDRFGNLATNISGTRIAHANPDAVVIRVGHHCITGISASYSGVREGRALALIGSRGSLEIAVNRANAARRLNVAKGAPVVVTLKQTS